MTTNLELLMLLVSHLQILDKDLSTPPGSPAIGDMYIPAPTATGDWAGHEGEIAIWWQGPNDASALWIFYSLGTAEEGVRLWVADEDIFAVWDGTGWTTEQAFENLLAKLAIIDRDLTAPPGSPAVGDAYIPAATATGAWAGQENNIAVWWQEPGAAAAWKFRTPNTGIRAYIIDEDVLSLWDSTSWTPGLSV
jgi:hypothetical protein